MLPKEVMLKAQHEFLNFNETGISVMEMSHRSKEYLPIVEKAEKNLRNLLNIPNNYKVLFLQGGAITQNFMVPMNLLSNRSASYVVSGYWSKRTYNDAQPFGTIKSQIILKKYLVLDLGILITMTPMFTFVKMKLSMVMSILIHLKYLKFL